MTEHNENQPTSTYMLARNARPIGLQGQGSESENSLSYAFRETWPWDSANTQWSFYDSEFHGQEEQMKSDQDRLEGMILLQGLLDHPRVYHVTMYRLVRSYNIVVQLKATHAMGPMQRRLFIRRQAHERTIPGQQISAMGETPMAALLQLADTIRKLDEQRRRGKL